MQDSEPGSLRTHTQLPPRILYLATSFPRFSETFLQREVRYLRNHVQLDIGSLWGGEGNFDKQPVQTATLRDLPRALTRIPGWLLRKPAAFREILERLLRRRLPMVQNWLENFWGFAWALDRAGDILRNPPDLVHATWGTMPAATALALHKLIVFFRLRILNEGDHLRRNNGPKHVVEDAACSGIRTIRICLIMKANFFIPVGFEMFNNLSLKISFS